MAEDAIIIANGGDIVTSNIEFDCREKGGVVWIQFTNEGSNDANIIFGGSTRLLLGSAAGSPQTPPLVFHWDYPYVDFTTYRIEFVNPQGNNTRRLIISYAKRLTYGRAKK